MPEGVDCREDAEARSFRSVALQGPHHETGLLEACLDTAPRPQTCARAGCVARAARDISFSNAATTRWRDVG